LNYGFVLSAGNCNVEGACGCAFGDDCCVGTVEVFTSCNILFSLPVLALEINKTDMMQSIANADPKIHVPFSSTSVVCFTPMNWLLKPANVPLKPPPFGF